MRYKLVDSGNQQKLEQFGEYLLVRPCAQAIWQPKLSQKIWQEADAVFTREGGNRWNGKLPGSWFVELEGIKFRISPTDFGHLGIFPEHSFCWSWMHNLIKSRKAPVKVLNLFAYSGGATLAAAKAGAEVCHLDASKATVAWARENAAHNHLNEAPIRWIVDDVLKFLAREEKRGTRYDGIILDPPSFGRGRQGEVFKIERDLLLILKKCQNLLSANPLFFIFTTHTPGMTPIVMKQLLDGMFNSGVLEAGEMVLPGDGHQVPCGSFAKWSHED